mmetsp:Transcript_12278/g.31736  ORF Transcript_12278/g.31736 Transcript_12278/m.31736 type:complete len:92 (+) Transcript_12278:19-294(+)
MANAAPTEAERALGSHVTISASLKSCAVLTTSSEKLHATEQDCACALCTAGGGGANVGGLSTSDVGPTSWMGASTRAAAAMMVARRLSVAW